MPLYEFECLDGHRQEHFLSMEERNSRFLCSCGKKMRRLPGGHGLLYFEESRARTHIGLSDRPIASWRQHQRSMKAAGVDEMGDNIPKAIRDNPQSEGMKRHLEKDSKGRWI